MRSETTSVKFSSDGCFSYFFFLFLLGGGTGGPSAGTGTASTAGVTSHMGVGETTPSSGEVEEVSTVPLGSCVLPDSALSLLSPSPLLSTSTSSLFCSETPSLGPFFTGCGELENQCIDCYGGHYLEFLVLVTLTLQQSPGLLPLDPHQHSHTLQSCSPPF